MTVNPITRRLFAEGLGTAFLLATVIGSGIMAERLAGGNQALALLCNAIPTGAILAVLITIFGPVSGAHLNPAVSFVFALRREIAWPEFLSYAAASDRWRHIGDVACPCDVRAARLANFGHGKDRPRPMDR